MPIIECFLLGCTLVIVTRVVTWIGKAITGNGENHNDPPKPKAIDKPTRRIETTDERGKLTRLGFSKRDIKYGLDALRERNIVTDRLYMAILAIAERMTK
jgi:hypothetical protein